MKLRTKEENYERYHAGAYGNKLCTWERWQDLLQDDYCGDVTIRYRQAGSPFCQYGIPFYDVPVVVIAMRKLGADLRMMSFNECAPDHLLLIQGEVMRDEHFLTLTYSTLPLPMREALKRELRTARGLEALGLLRRHLNPASWDDLQELFDRYPDSVIEFSAFSCDLGSRPHRNTIFWETRNY